MNTDMTTIGSKAGVGNNFGPYSNSDHAGTPETYKAFVTGGATGGGGSNWTGSYSSTASVSPTVGANPFNNPPSSQTTSLSGTVFYDNNGNGIFSSGDSGLPVMTVTLTDANGNAITTMTDANGAYSFTGL